LPRDGLFTPEGTGPVASGSPLMLGSAIFADLANLAAALAGVCCMAAGLLIGRRR
jgi:hypothetical protein